MKASQCSCKGNKTQQPPAAPKLEYFEELLDVLPPFIARKKVPWFTGGAISSKKMANDDALSIGPRVRQKIGDTIVYPTPFFLEYLERKGVHTIVVPQL